MCETTRKIGTFSIASRFESLGRHRGLYVGVDPHRDVMQIEVQTRGGGVLLNDAFPADPPTVREILGVLRGRVPPSVRIGVAAASLAGPRSPGARRPMTAHDPMQDGLLA